MNQLAELMAETLNRIDAVFVKRECPVCGAEFEDKGNNLYCPVCAGQVADFVCGEEK